MKYSSIIILLLIGLVSCEKFLNPKISEERSYDQLLTQPGQIKGLVSFAYRSIPSNQDWLYGDFLDCATDNAASNNLSGTTSRMVEINSFWSASRTPFEYNWNYRYEEIMNLNEFFDIMANNDITFLKSSAKNDSLLKATTTGEAFFLRAWCHFDLLRFFGGKDLQGEMKGIPLITAPISPEEFLNLGRPAYDTAVRQIIQDLDSAIAYLPVEWSGSSLNEYENTSNLGRPTDEACVMLKSRVLLYAASPLFTEGLSEDKKEQRWISAAEAALEAINLIGWKLPYVYLDDLEDMKKYYNNPQTEEAVLRRVPGATGGDRLLETSHSLPSLYGSGRCNPTQNLVDAFPMRNGYPITDSRSGYDPNNMYADRDPRFYMTILYNGAEFGASTVETFEGGKDLEGGSELANVSNSTRTGYYMRKWLSDKVVLASGQEIDDYHYAALFRKVEMHLNFAEAMNEAYGPTFKLGGYSAEDALLEVVSRAVYLTSYPYVTEVVGEGQETTRNYIKNERRIELCFEGGHRFFDIRRWKEPLNSTVQGVDIPDAGSPGVLKDLYTIVFGDDQYYSPLPQNELNKMPNLTQNQGW